MSTKDFTSQELQEISVIKGMIESVYLPSINKVLGVELIKMDGIIIAGGMFTSLITHHKIKDIDVFLLANPVLKGFVEDRIGKSFVKGDSDYLGNPMIEDVYVEKGSNVPIQFIFTKYRTREELIKHFDYKHCCISYDVLAQKLFVSPYNYACAKQKKLIVNNLTNIKPYREDKFLRKGFVKEAL